MSREFENMEIGADVMSALHTAEKGSVLNKSIDYTRPLNEYPKADVISDHVNFLHDPRHIYTKTLNINGVAVQDKMDKYLTTEGLQSSHLKAALKTPLHYQFSKDDDKKSLEKFKNRKHFQLGTYLHECILEPTKFSRVIVEPKRNLASKEGVDYLIKFWKETIRNQEFGFNEAGEKITVQEAFEIAKNKVRENELDIEKQDGKKCFYNALKVLSGLQSVSEEHYIKIKILKKHYDTYGNGILPKILKHSKREISFYKQHESGLTLKCRPDAIQFEENIGVNAVISVKSTSQPDLRGFMYHAAQLHYDLSEGMYQEVVSDVTARDFNTTIMIMLQTVEPFGIAVLVWSAKDIETGKYKFRTALDIVQQCEASQTFQGYEAFAEDENGLINMELPAWNGKEFLPMNV